MMLCTNKIKKSRSKKLEKSQSERTAELSDPKLFGTSLNSVNSSFKSKKKEESLL